ncbi:hypothetical protein BGZ59_006763 [Podila verticillata]|nr:hypothetical protein BGZ59_006763 [Podila verticillata]KFH71432.1 hypothetical protein MVEG_01731 [Podila verticillata NRRL 6337]
MEAGDEPYDFLTWHSNVPELKDEKKELKKEKKQKKEDEKKSKTKTSKSSKKKASKKAASDSEDSDSDSEDEKSKKKSKPVKKTEKKRPAPSSDSSDSSSSESDDPDTQPPPKSKKKKNKKKKTKKANFDGENNDDEEAAAPENEDGEGESGASGDKKKEKKEKKEKKDGPGRKGEFGIWIGNLSFLTTDKTLRYFFRSAGEITRVNMPSGSGYNKKGNKGFAYVDFASAEAQTKAIALSEQELDGRKVLIKSSKSYEGRPMVTKTSVHEKAQKQKHAVSPTLFVGNLSFQTTRESLQKLFEDAGEIRKVRLATFEDSGKCKGFAYIDYMAPESATTALTDNKKHFLDGRKLNLEYASAEATLKGNPREYRKHKREEADAEAIARGEVPPSQKEDAEAEAAATAADEERRAFNAEQKAKRQRRAPGEAPVKKMQGHQRPGFALANAQRATQGIVEFKGNKVTF